MFTIAQHIGNMETTKNTFRYLLSFTIILILGACSSTTNLPVDDVYYSSNTPNSTQYNWDDYQKNAQSYSDNNVVKDNSSEGYNSEYLATAGSGLVTSDGESGEYEFVDEYYDSDYASRISRFNGEGTSDDYYSDSYSGCGGCGGSNFSLSLGMGMGLGYGMTMGYGYGWPYYSYGWPYYSWGYPYGWGYPYYGGSYWAGYNRGYWDGYYSGGGYYGGGGYYPDYGYGYTSSYGPRGRGAGGSSIPGSGNGRSGSASNPSSKKIIDDNRVARSGAVATSNPSASRSHTAQGLEKSSGKVNSNVRPENSVRIVDNPAKRSEPNNLSKPAQNTQSKPSTGNNRYRKPTTITPQQSQATKYKKPKSYESLPSRQPRSSKEYVRPTNTSTTKANRSATKDNRPNSNTYNRSVKQTNTRSNYSAPRPNTSSRSNSNAVKIRTTSTPKSYKAPSTRSSSSGSSSTPSRSYSAPSRSTSSGSSGSSRSGGSSSSSSSRSGGGRR